MNYDFNKKKVTSLMVKYNKIARKKRRTKTIRDILFTFFILSLFLILANTFSQNQNYKTTDKTITKQNSNDQVEDEESQQSVEETADSTENSSEDTKVSESTNQEDSPGEDSTDSQDESIENAIKMDEYYQNKLTSFNAFKNRQEELKLKEKELKQKEDELKILQDEVEKKIIKYEKLKKEVEGLLVQLDSQHKKKITQLTSVYEGMNPEEAAKILSNTEEDITIEILLAMDNKKACKILENMTTEKAVNLSEKIADKR